MVQKELKKFIDHAGVEWISGDDCYGDEIYFAKNWFKHDVSAAGFTLKELKNKEFYDRFVSIKEEKETMIIIHEDDSEEIIHLDTIECAVSGCENPAIGSVYRGNCCVPYCKQHEGRV